MTNHEATNRAAWNEFAEDYQAENAPQLMAQAFTGELSWGTWHIPESQLQVLGEVRDKDVLEFGSGAAQMSIALSHHGARAVGLDLSESQLAIARRLMRETGVTIPIVQGSGERAPFGDGSFDVVFSDYGALFWADPYLTVPEVARLLRPDGLLAFTHYSPISTIATPYHGERAQERFVNDYFGMHTVPLSDGTISFQLPYGEWTQLFRRCGLVVEELIEPRPDEDASSTYADADDLRWARRWPWECIWRVRKPVGP
jgi:SAM-dependent methyltransferase